MVRPARPSDSTSIALVQIQTWHSTYGTLLPETYLDSMQLEDYAAKWSDWLAHKEGLAVFVSEDHGRIVGFA